MTSWADGTYWAKPSGSAVQRFGFAPKVETNNGCNMTGKEPPQLGRLSDCQRSRQPRSDGSRRQRTSKLGSDDPLAALFLHVLWIGDIKTTWPQKHQRLSRKRNHRRSQRARKPKNERRRKKGQRHQKTLNGLWNYSKAGRVG